MKKSASIISSFLLIYFITLLSGCKKHDNTPLQVSVPSGVYIVGEANTGSGVLWNSGKMNYLTDSTTGSGAYSLFVNGQDVYVGGEVSSSIYPNIPAYWKNGVITQLNSSVGGNNGWVNAIFVTGADVYAAGTTGDWNHTYGILWINGVATVLDSLVAPAGSWNPRCEASSVYVDGSDVWVSGLGHGGLACYWKNGVQTLLPSAAINSGGNAIAVSQSQTYIAGEITDSPYIQAAYWKNGVATGLRVSSPGNSIARSIYFQGSDQYICGDQTIGDSSAATYWKNGEITVLGTRYHSSDALAIFVRGEDVYIAGIDGNYGCYWKNGKETLLSYNAIALGIYAQ